MTSIPPPTEHSLTVALRQALRHTAVVLVVAVTMATIYTVWTPASLLPRSAARDIARALATRVGYDATPIPPTATPEPRPRIGVVAGHLGHDSGAVCPDGLREVDVNLDVANRVKLSLEQAGFQVDLLNEYDTRLEGYQAQALVSVHSDSCDFINEAATGFKVAGSLVSHVPTETDHLAACLIDRYAERTQMQFHAGSITFDMTYYHAFNELAPETPAVIVEVGFLNLDRDMLTNHADLVAQGVTEGVMCYVWDEPVSFPE